MMAQKTAAVIIKMIFSKSATLTKKQITAKTIPARIYGLFLSLISEEISRKHNINNAAVAMTIIAPPIKEINSITPPPIPIKESA